VLWNITFPEWPRKERNNHFPNRPKFHIFVVTYIFKITKSFIFAVAKLSWSTVWKLIYKAKTKVLGLHTRCLKSISVFFRFQLLSCFRVYVIVKTVKIWKRSEGAYRTKMLSWQIINYISNRIQKKRRANEISNHTEK